MQLSFESIEFVGESKAFDKVNRDIVGAGQASARANKKNMAE
jgi:hypothetical protein